MANRYWVGASGAATNVTTSWSATSGGSSGASVPTAVDDIYFPAGTYTVLISTLRCYNCFITGSPTFSIGSNSIIFFGETIQFSSGTRFTGGSCNVYFRPGTGITQTVSGSNSAVSIPGHITLDGTGTVVFNSNLNQAQYSGVSGYDFTINSSCTINSILETGSVTSTATTVAKTITLNGILRPRYYGTASTGGAISIFTIPSSTNISWRGTGYVDLYWSNFVCTYGTTENADGFPNVVVSTASIQDPGFSGYFDTVTMPGTSYGGFTSSDVVVCKNFIIGGGNIPNFSVILFSNEAGGSYEFRADYSTTLGSISVTHSNVYVGTVLNTGSGAVTCSGFNLRGGTFDLNGKSITCSTAVVTLYTAVAGYSTRGINFGSNFIYLTTTTAAVVNLDAAAISTATFTGTGGFSAVMDRTRTFSVGNTNRNTAALPSLFLTSGASVPTITATSYFNTLSFAGTTFNPGAISPQVYGSLYLGTATYSTFAVVLRGAGGVLSGNSRSVSSINISLSDPANTTTLTTAITVASTGTTTMTQGTLTLNVSMSTGIFSSNSTSTRTINFGTNFISLTSAVGGTTVLSMANALNFSASGTGGFVSNGASSRTFSVGITTVPTVAPNLFLTTGASNVVLNDNSYFNVLDFTSSTSSVFSSGGGPIYVDTLTLASGGTYTSFVPAFTRTQTWTPQFTKTLLGIGVNNPAATLTLDATQAYASTRYLYIDAGTINLNNTTQTFTYVISSGVSGTARSVQGPGTINVSDFWSVPTGAGFTGSNYSIRMTSAAAKFFNGAGGSYGTLVQAGSGALTIAGNNTFADIQATTRPSTITFTAGTTQTLANFTLSGTAGAIVTINSTTAGSQYTLSKSSGTVSVNYLTIQDSNVTGGAYWGTTTSTFVSNNTGWNPVKSTGNFMAFF